MTDISVILPGEFKYEIKFCWQIPNLRVMDDFVQKMHVFETIIFEIFEFRTLLQPQTSAWPPKTNIFLESTFHDHVHPF